MLALTRLFHQDGTPMHIRITIDGEGKPFFLLVTTIEATLFVGFAVIIGMSAQEQRLFLTLLFTLYLFNMFGLLFFIDQSARWYVFGRRLFTRSLRRSINRLIKEHQEAITKAQELQAAHDVLYADHIQLQNELRATQRDLTDRERDLASARRQVELERDDKESIRAESRRTITKLTEEKAMKTTKEQGQSLTAYALIISLVILLCLGLLSAISAFPYTVFMQLTEML